ncbi:hypothetical protein D3C72_814770 [compost metagenome]
MARPITNQAPGTSMLAATSSVTPAAFLGRKMSPRPAKARARDFHCRARPTRVAMTSMPVPGQVVQAATWRRPPSTGAQVKAPLTDLATVILFSISQGAMKNQLSAAPISRLRPTRMPMMAPAAYKSKLMSRPRVSLSQPMPLKLNLAGSVGNDAGMPTARLFAPAQTPASLFISSTCASLK